jgi:hypothetical protein
MPFVLKQNDESCKRKKTSAKRQNSTAGLKGNLNNGTHNTTFNLSHWATWGVFEYFAN